MTGGSVDESEGDDEAGESDESEDGGDATARPTLTSDDIPGRWPDESRLDDRATPGGADAADDREAGGDLDEGSGVHGHAAVPGNERDGDDEGAPDGDVPDDGPPTAIATDEVVEASVPDDAEETLSATLARLTEYGYALDSPLDLATTPPVSDEVATAGRHSQCSDEETWQLVTALAEAGPLTVGEATEQVLASRIAVQGLLSEMRSASLVRRTDDGAYALDYRAMAERIERYEVRRAEMDPLDREWPGAGE